MERAAQGAEIKEGSAQRSPLAKLELIISCFAPIVPGARGTPREELVPAYEYLAALWNATSGFDMNEPVPDLAERGVRTEFPSWRELHESVGEFRLLGGRRAPADHPGVYQAFAFHQHDVVGLVVELAPNNAVDGPSTWRGLEKAWLKLVPESRPAQIFGEAYVFAGLLDAAIDDPVAESLDVFSSSAVRDLLGSCRPDDQVPISLGPFTINGGWEDDDLLVRLGILAPTEHEAALGEWAAWPDLDGLAPMPRYLMHSAKLRHAYRVYRGTALQLGYKQQLARARSEVAEALDALEDELETRLSETQDVRVSELVESHGKATKALTRVGGVHDLISILRELRQTAHLAVRNMSDALPAAAGASPGSFAYRDVALGKLLPEQIESDLVYGQATLDRAQEAHRRLDFRLRDAADQTNRRQQELTLLQTSLLGSLIAGFSARGALNLQLHAPEAVDVSIIATVMAVVLTLPLLVMHRREGYGMIDKIAGALSGATICWLITSILWWKIPVHASMALTLLSIPPGAGLGLLVVQALDRPR
jgi:hypothetical protein